MTNVTHWLYRLKREELRKKMIQLPWQRFCPKLKENACKRLLTKKRRKKT